MSHEVESMAYTGNLPWHGLGTQVESGITPEEIAVAAGLDWTVSKRRILTDNGDEPGLPTDEWFMLVRDSDNKILGPAGRNYIPTQNLQALSFFKEFTEAGEMTMETAGSLKGGKVIWGLAKIGQSFTLPGDDKVEGYLLLSSPHEWGKSLTVMYTPIRVVCNNTLTAALNAGGQRFSHRHAVAFGPEVQKEAKKSLGMAVEKTEKFEAQATQLAETKVDDKFVTEFYDRMFGRDVEKDDGTIEIVVPRTVDVMEEARRKSPGATLYSANDTAWGLLNGVTYFYDHLYGRSGDDSRLTSAWFGGNAGIKRRALKTLLDMAA